MLRAMDLMHCCKARTDSCDNMRPHGKVAVNMDTKVASGIMVLLMRTGFGITPASALQG